MQKKEVTFIFFLHLLFFIFGHMRVKLVVPSLRLKCWFAAHEEKTIYQLQKSILKELSLEAEASEIVLTLDDFILLPRCIVKDLIHEGDTLW